jgi:hypothetical protein
LSCVFVGIGLIISNGNKNLDTDNSWMPWEGSFFFLFTICLGMVAYTIIKPMITLTVDKKKNDNFLYYFRWQNIVFSLGIFVLFLLFSLVNNPNVFIIFSWPVSGGGMWIWFIGLILLIVSLSSLIGLTIVTALLNPKADREAMENMIKKYIAEISSGQTPPSSFVQ